MPHRRADEFNTLTLAAAARFTGVARDTVYLAIRQGQLRTYRVGKQDRLLRVDVVHWKRKRLTRK